MKIFCFDETKNKYNKMSSNNIIDVEKQFNLMSLASSNLSELELLNIFNNLDSETLVNVCSSNIRFKNICHSDPKLRDKIRRQIIWDTEFKDLTDYKRARRLAGYILVGDLLRAEILLQHGVTTYYQGYITPNPTDPEETKMEELFKKYEEIRELEFRRLREIQRLQQHQDHQQLREIQRLRDLRNDLGVPEVVAEQYHDGVIREAQYGFVLHPVGDSYEIRGVIPDRNNLRFVRALTEEERVIATVMGFPISNMRF